MDLLTYLPPFQDSGPSPSLPSLLRVAGMSAVSQQQLGESTVQCVRRNGWDVGTRLVGDEGYGPTVIRITAIGQRRILAVMESHKDEKYDYERESMWTLECRDWQLA